MMQQDEKTIPIPTPITQSLPELVEEDVKPPVMRHHEFIGWDRRSIDVPVFRRTKEKKHYEQQMKLYSPCSCGSKKNFKFCCKGKDLFVLNTDAG